jgi:hypothetical protein
MTCGCRGYVHHLRAARNRRAGVSGGRNPPPPSASMYIIYFFPVNGICGRENHKKDTLLS